MLVLALTVSACSAGRSAPDTAAASEPTSERSSEGETEASDAETAASASVELERVQFVNPLPDEQVWRTISDCMRDVAEAEGIEFIESGPTGGYDATAVVEQLLAATTQGVDALVAFPGSDAINEVLAQAQDEGIITTTLYGSGEPDSGADINVGVDWNYIGNQQVEAVSGRSGEQIVGLVTQDDTGVGKSWLDGVKAAAENFDNVTIVDEVYIGVDASQALPQVSSMLSANPDITMIVTNHGFTNTGGVAAIQQRGLEGQVELMAMGGDASAVSAMESGVATMMFLQDLCGMGGDTMRALIERAAAGPSDDVDFVEVRSVVATEDDYEAYIEDGWL